MMDFSGFQHTPAAAVGTLPPQEPSTDDFFGDIR
jgi:hypothetical protein